MPQDAAACPPLCTPQLPTARGSHPTATAQLTSSTCWTGGTFTALHSNFSKRVVAAVALPPDDTRFARALSRLHVAGTRVGAGWEAVAGVAGVTALGPVVICLEKPKRQIRGI